MAPLECFLDCSAHLTHSRRLCNGVRTDAFLFPQPVVMAGRAGGRGAALASFAAQEGERHRLFHGSAFSGRSTGTPEKSLALAEPVSARPPGFGLIAHYFGIGLALSSPR